MEALEAWRNMLALSAPLHLTRGGLHGNPPSKRQIQLITLHDRVSQSSLRAPVDVHLQSPLLCAPSRLRCIELANLGGHVML